MKLSVNWINDFIPLNSVPWQSVLDIINTSICEIDDVEEYFSHLETVISVQILSIEKHPNAEKLSITTCSDGQKNHTIVTGATNIKVQDIVPLALPGTVLGNKKIEVSELRGVMSSGMYGSEKELSLSEDSNGVMILPNGTPLGVSLRKILNLEDKILHVDNKSITHRPDLWCHFGFARELSAHLKLPIQFNPLQLKQTFSNGSDGVSVLPSSLAHAYYVSSIRNVKIKESIPKIKSRLVKCGIKSINNVVDVSNYMLLEVGQPTHFFDRSRLPNLEFSVTESQPKESIQLLDDSKLDLPEKSLLVRAGGVAQILAGIMGGKESSVQLETQDLILESAIFPRELVRQGIRATGIRTESAMRYEKGLDTHTAIPVIHRALDLLKENLAGDFQAFTPTGFDHQSEKELKIKLSLDFVAQKLGVFIEFPKVKSILEALYFKVSPISDTEMEVVVPRFRHNYDVTIQEDLIEEIGRSIGYGNIERKKLSFEVRTPIPNTIKILERKLKLIFSQSLSFHEVLNYSFSSESSSLAFNPDKPILKISNAMPEEHSVMRTSLSPGLLNNAKSNQDRFQDISIFEVGRCYQKTKDRELGKETRVLSALTLSESKPTDLRSIEREFLTFRDKVSQSLEQIGIGVELNKSENYSYFHPSAALEVVCEGRVVGEIGILESRLQDDFDLKRRAFLSTIFTEALDEILLSRGNVSHFTPPSQFPGGDLDITLILEQNQATEHYLTAVKKRRIPELKKGFVYSDFRNDSLGESKKAISYRFLLMSYDKTFTQDRFKEVSDLLVQIAKEEGFTLR